MLRSLILHKVASFELIIPPKTPAPTTAEPQSTAVELFVYFRCTVYPRIYIPLGISYSLFIDATIVLLVSYCEHLSCIMFIYI